MVATSTFASFYYRAKKSPPPFFIYSEFWLFASIRPNSAAELFYLNTILRQNGTTTVNTMHMVAYHEITSKGQNDPSRMRGYTLEL